MCEDDAMCTSTKIVAQNGAVVCGRTLEFAQHINSQILMIPRNYAYKGTGPSGEFDGLEWKTRYAAVGANAENLIGLVDGVNEKGLAGGLFYFPEYAKYQKVSQEQSKQSIAPWELLTWILTNCATIEEVKQHLPIIKVSDTIFKPWGIIPPLHAIIHDVSGKSIVIEYLSGELHITDNPLGVLTNAPSFDWHMINLKNYLNLTPLNISSVELKDIRLTALSQGSGMLGLPGDFTSPSRFIRMAAYTESLVSSKTEGDARRTLFHMLNLFDIPFGSVRQKENGHIHYEFTQWTSVSDLVNRRYYISTYENRAIQMVDLMKMDLESQEPIVITIEHPETIRDITL